MSKSNSKSASPPTKSTSTSDSPRVSKSAEKQQARILSGDSVTLVNASTIYKWSEMDMGAGEAFELVYGFKPNVYLAAAEIDSVNARDWWERASTGTQCGNVIGEVVYGKPEIQANGKTRYQPRKMGTTCYICGFEILESDRSSAECEHVLPVYKAALYLTLYNTEQHREIFRKWKSGLPLSDNEQRIVTELSMEYLWAHRCCNQKKSDKDFITFMWKDDKWQFSLDYNSTYSILNDIVDKTLSPGDEHCKEPSLKAYFTTKGFNKEEWINERIDALNAAGSGGNSAGGGEPPGPVRKIIDYLNEVNNKQGVQAGLNTLGNLCNLISAANMDAVWSVWHHTSGVVAPPKSPKENPIIILKKATVLDLVTARASKMSIYDWGKSINRDRDIKLRIYDLYRKAFDITLKSNWEIVINFIPDTNKQIQDISAAILGSLLNINKLDPAIGDFFSNFCAILTKNNLAGQLPIFPLIGQDKRENAQIQLDAATIVGQAFTIVLFARMTTNIESEAANFTDVPAYDGFRNVFRTAFEEEINKIIQMMNDYSFNDDKRCIFSKMMLTLCTNITPSIVTMIKDSLNNKLSG